MGELMKVEVEPVWRRKRIGGVRAGEWSDQKKNRWVWVVEPNSMGGGVEAS